MGKEKNEMRMENLNRINCIGLQHVRCFILYTNIQMVNENIKFGLYKLFENYIETFSGYEYDIRCISEEVIESLILDVIEYIEAKE